MLIKSLFKGLFAVAITLCMMTSCNTDEPSVSPDNTNIVPAKSISLNENTLSITVDETKTLSATVLPNNTTDKHVTWNTSDASVATVSGGVVKGINTGSAVITATCGSVSATCTVNVHPKPGNYQCVFGYLYTEDLLKFLTPTITIAIDGKEPMVYTLNYGNNTPAEDGIKYNDVDINSGPSGATFWWIGKDFDTEQSGTVTISYEKTDIDYSEYDNMTDLPFEFWSEPFVNQVKRGSISINMNIWISINIGPRDTLSGIIDKIINSKSNTYSF